MWSCGCRKQQRRGGDAQPLGTQKTQTVARVWRIDDVADTQKREMDRSNTNRSEVVMELNTWRLLKAQYFSTFSIHSIQLAKLAICVLYVHYTMFVMYTLAIELLYSKAPPPILAVYTRSTLLPWQALEWSGINRQCSPAEAEYRCPTPSEPTVWPGGDFPSLP